ncbi:MAG: hypothetical protein O2815_01755 [Actinomycetota bacterium]|nr:hypothetical protein [Actinomycetota bacterium]
MEIEPVTPDDEGRDDERFFAERWERWKREKRELNALRGDGPRLSTAEIIQMIRDGREERLNQILQAVDDRDHLRRQSQEDPQ